MSDHDSSRGDSSCGDAPNPPEVPKDSALLVAARQLSEEAALRPRLAGLSGVRQRTVATAARRAARRLKIMPVGRNDIHVTFT